MTSRAAWGTSRTHRRLSVAALAVALFAVAALPLGAVGVSDEPTRTSRLDPSAVTRLRLDLSHVIDNTVPVAPQSLGPLPPANMIGPGSHLLITMAGGLFGCTANFVWTAGSTTYLGAAGHCFLPEGTTATHGPGADYNPAGTSVRVCVSACNFGGETGFIFQGNTAQLGPVAYARQTQGGVDIGNDFGIVTIPSSLAAQIRPSMPLWGGPHGSQPPTFGQGIVMYGNGIIVGETFATMARTGVDIDGLIEDPDPSLWNALVPSQPGDSGSAVEFLSASTTTGPGGPALGILTHALIGAGTYTWGTTVAKAKTMATQAGLNINLVNGV